MTYFDYKHDDDDFYRHLPPAERFTIERELLAAPLMMLALVLLLAGLVRLGFVRFPYYQAQAAQNTVARITLQPPRGEILDRHGNPLAVNHAVYDCYFISSDDIDADVRDLTDLGHFLGLSDPQLDQVIDSRRQFAGLRSMQSELWAAGWGAFGARSILVRRDLNQVQVVALLERTSQFPRAFLERAYRRSYPAGKTTAQVVGYTGQISERELGELTPLGYRISDMIGKAGLERQYDNFLRGRPGERLVAIDARGRILGDAEMVPAVVPADGAVVVRGDDVAVLTEGGVTDLPGGIRVRMRTGVVEAVETGYGVMGGRERAVHRTLFSDNGRGGIFDDWYVFRRQGEIARIDERVITRPSIVPPTGGSPLRITLDLDMQRAIETIMAGTVGGVIAMDPRDGAILAMVSVPAFDPNLFAPGGVDPEGWQGIMSDPHFPLLNRPIQNAYVPGSIFKIATALAASDAGLAGRTWTCHGSIEIGNRTFRCWNRGGHGTVNFSDAVAQSCDVAFWEMAQDLGRDRIAHVAQSLGLASPLGVDLPDERAGLIPDDQWKRARFGERWFLGDTMNMAIGQGFVQLTVLQVARMTAVVANGGYLVPPHLNRLLNPAPTSIDRIPVDQRSIEAVRRGLRRVVTEGTGRACNLDWIQLAGKTGTADDPPREHPHSWFTSFGPYENPSLVIVVFCENGAHAPLTAVPLARQIWQSPPIRRYLSDG